MVDWPNIRSGIFHANEAMRLDNSRRPQLNEKRICLHPLQRRRDRWLAGARI